MDKQRSDPFRAIKPEIRNKAIEQPRSLSMSVEMWMEMNGRFWNHVNLANQTCSSSNCLYFMLFCFNISFLHFYHQQHHFFCSDSRQIWVVTMWLHVPQPSLCFATELLFSAFHELQCAGWLSSPCAWNQCNYSAQKPSFEYIVTWIVKPKAFISFDSLRSQDVIQFIKRYSSLRMDNLKMEFIRINVNSYEMTKHDQTVVNQRPEMMAWSSRLSSRSSESRNKRSCGTAIVVNNNAKWFKSDDGERKF